MKNISLLILILLTSTSAYSKLSKATFAGGCFWCTEADFEKLEGVHDAISGYSGGVAANPNYKLISSGKTQYLEVVQVIFDDQIISYKDLLVEFFQSVNPTDSGGQFVDRGYQYTSAIFYHNLEQKKIATAYKDELDEKIIFEKKIVTPIRVFKKFVKAEEYHQDFYKKNAHSIKRYKNYRKNSGRDQFRIKIWGRNKKKYTRPSDKVLKVKLNKIQFKVTRQNGTEKPFKNEYWNNKKMGIYIDLISGEALFSSKDKFKSGTGWPSFTKPINRLNITTKIDQSLFSSRTEVRSNLSDSHLGHVFKDGPKPLGLRYCINSASLKFIPVEKMKEKGFGKYLKIFEN